MKDLLQLTVHTFAQRHFQQEAPYTFWDGTPSDVEDEVRRNWELRKPSSFNHQVMEVPVSVAHVTVPYTELEQGDEAIVVFDVRGLVDGAAARISSPRVPPAWAKRLPAQVCIVICYPSALLAENGVMEGKPDPQNQLPAVEGNWEVVSINAALAENEPMHHGTILYNEWASGGTPSGVLHSLALFRQNIAETDDSEVVGHFEKIESWCNELLRAHKFWHSKASL